MRMRPLSGFFERKAVPALGAMCLLAGLAGCVKPVPPPPPQVTAAPRTDGQTLDDLRSGKAALDCGPACAPKWVAALNEAQAHYNAEEWRDLALLVIRIDYPQDLAYYYLGRAAEGLGQRSAALTYYGTAKGLATGADTTAKCAASQAGCNGLSLLTEILTRTQIVDVARSRSYAARHPLRGKPDTGQPAEQPPGNWVDPAPSQ